MILQDIKSHAGNEIDLWIKADFFGIFTFTADQAIER